MKKWILIIVSFLAVSCSSVQKKPDIDYSLTIVEGDSISAEAEIAFQYSVVEADLTNGYQQDGHILTNALDLCLWGSIDVTVTSECRLMEAVCSVCVYLPQYELCFDVGEEGDTGNE